MAAARPFADMLARFLTVHLPVTRACSRNTISPPTGTPSRCSWGSWATGRRPRRTRSPSQTSPRRTWRPSSVGCAPTGDAPQPPPTQRLAALKSFFRYIQAEAPEQIAQAQQVLGVKAAQAPEPAIGYLPVEAVGLLLEHAKRRGPRDLALLATLYDTAARIQEACDLSLGDLRLGKPPAPLGASRTPKSRCTEGETHPHGWV